MVARTAVITGANRGIGLAVAEALTERGVRVVLVSRAPPSELPRAATAVLGDRSSVRTTRELARTLLATCPRIDVFIHNAGLWPSRLERNEDGVERAFAVNHVAPFVLNRLLEERFALGVALRLVKRLWKEPAIGARPVVRLALDESPGTGRYFHVDEETPLLPVARDAALARALWDHAEGLLGT